MSIRPGWFYHADQDAKVKSLATLVDIYFKSIGRNSVLLLNIPPDPRGRIAEADVQRLREFRTFVDQLYAVDFARSTGPDQALTDGKLETTWSPGEGAPTGQVELDLGRDCTFNVARIQEDVRSGERVQGYRVEVFGDGEWRSVTAGSVIGHKQLRRFPSVTARRVRLVIV